MRPGAQIAAADVSDLGSLADLVGEAGASALVGWEHMLTQATTVGNVLMCAAYAALALLAMTAARPAEPPPAWNLRWLFGAAVLTGLAGLTLLRLDLLLVLFMRSLAHSLGWYAQRGPVQTLVLAAFVAVLAAWVASGLHNKLAHGLRPGSPRLRIGLGLLVLVAGLRMVSLHQADRLLAWSIGTVSLGRFAETCGLVLVALAVWPAVRAR